MTRNLRLFVFAAFFLSSLIIFNSSCKKENEGTSPQEDPQTEYPDRGFGFVRSSMEELLEVPIADTLELGGLRSLSLGPTFSLHMPPIKSQGNLESSCVAFAAGYAARSYAFRADNNNTPYANDNTFSPEYLYNLTKESGNCKSGSSIRSALEHMKNVGICTWDVLEYSGTNGCDISGWDPDVYENVGCYKIDDFKRIAVTNVGVMKRWIGAGYPIICGMRVDSSLFWRNWSTKPYYDPSFIWKEQVGEWDTEGHAMVITGWDDSKNAWKVMNSYGERYGDGGYGWIDYDFLDEALAAWRVLDYNLYFMYIMYTSSLSQDCIEPDSLEMMPGGNNQTGKINTQLPQPLEVLVKDKNGNPLEGAEVNFFVIEGSGSIPQQEVLTNPDGIARTYWTLGNLVGEQKLSVSCWDSNYEPVNGSPMEFTATATGADQYFTDPRDGQTYKIVTIGNQTWFAQNLNYETPNSWWYDNNSAYGDISGRLYTWAAAMDACPAGWHLPSDNEWKTLEMHLGMSQNEADKTGFRGSDEGRKLKSKVGWYNNGIGTDEVDFRAFPGGHGYNDGRPDERMFEVGIWWTATTSSPNYAWARELKDTYDEVYRFGPLMENAFSVRCIKD